MAPGSQKEATRAESRLSCNGNRTCVVFAYRAFRRRPASLDSLQPRARTASPNCSSDFSVASAPNAIASSARWNSKRPRRPRRGLTKTSGGSSASRARGNPILHDVERLDHDRRDAGTARLAEKLALTQLFFAAQAA